MLLAEGAELFLGGLLKNGEAFEKPRPKFPGHFRGPISTLITLSHFSTLVTVPLVARLRVQVRCSTAASADVAGPLGRTHGPETLTFFRTIRAPTSDGRSRPRALAPGSPQ